MSSDQTDERDGGASSGESGGRSETAGGHPEETSAAVGLYHPKAGTRDSGGISTFVREVTARLPSFAPTYLYTESGTHVDQLRTTGATVVASTPATDGALARGLDLLSGHLPQEIEESLRFFSAAVGDGTIRHVDRHVDVLYTHGLADTLLLANAVSVPVVRVFHTLDRVGVGGKSMRYLAPSAGVVANSGQTAVEITAKLGYGVDGVVYPGVDVEAFSPDRPPAFDREEDVVLFVGRFVESKGVFDLVEAFADLEGAHLHLVGRGDQRRLRRHAAACGTAESVTVEGPVPHERLPGYYAACDVFCLPSHYETFGLVNLEAMASGAPVVTSAIPAVEEYATHRETCWLVDPGDVDALASGLRTLLASPELRERLGAAGRAVAERYSWEESAADLARVSEKLVRPAPQRHV